MFFGREIKRAQDSAVHGNQMRRELNYNLLAGRFGKFLFDFGEMPVLRHSVGANTFVALDKEVIEFGFAAGAAHTAERVGDDPRRLDQLFAEQWEDWQQNARGITTRRGDERRTLDRVAIDLGQTVDRFREQVGRGM